MRMMSKLVYLLIAFVLIGTMACSVASASSISNVGVIKLADKQDDYNPNYSPDGKNIVFSSADFVSDPNHASIWIMNLTTGEINKVNIPDSKCLYYADWHPNGKQIIFRDSDAYNPGSDLYIINIDGTEKTCLTDDIATEVGDAHYSPDGSKIVYTCHIHQNGIDVSEIWLMNADGSNKLKLTNNGFDNSFPRFSPDGTKIVYSSGVWPNTHIWIMDSNGDNKIQLTSGDVCEAAPSWSPDGNHIAYQKSTGVNQPWNIWVMKADGSEQTQLTNYSKDGVDGGTPSWSPDGNKLVFVSGGFNSQNNNWDIWEMSLFRIFEVSDGVIVETPKVKYHLSNGGFAKELWVDHNGDGVYDENIGFADTTGRVSYFGFGSWYVITNDNPDPAGTHSVYQGSVFGSGYSYKIIENTAEKVVVEFTNTFVGLNAKTRWEIYPNGDAKVTPWTENPLENTYCIAFTWWITPSEYDIVGMRLSPDNELTSTVAFSGLSEIANPFNLDYVQRTSADFSDISYTHPYQFYNDNLDKYTLMLVEPKASKEQDWEWTESSQANDAIFGGRQDNRDPSWSLAKKVGLVDWMWYYDWSAEDGTASGPCDYPTTQPVNKDKKFSFYVHWIWGDTTETQRYEDAGNISEKLSGSGTPVLPVANFTSNVTQGVVPLSVQFTSLSKNTTNVSWDFENDGNTDSTENNPVHVYAVAGNYTVTLTAANENGTNSNSATITVAAWNTIPVSVYLRDSKGSPLSGAEVQYYNGSWKTFGSGTTDTEGKIVADLKAGTYTFRVNYEHTSAQITQNVGTDPNVNFQTSLVQARLLNSSGSVIDTNTANVKYYSGGWYDFGTTSGGIASKELFAGNSQTFRMIYQNVSKDITQNTTQNPTVDFQTSLVQARLLNSSGSVIDTNTANVKYYSGGWYDFGTTSGGIASKELFTGNSQTFRMTYQNVSKDITQNTIQNPIVDFQTSLVQVRLLDNTGALMDVDDANVKYYSGGWRDFGTTADGKVEKELFPVNYTFRMSYKYTSQDIAKSISGLNGLVEFRTGKVISSTCTNYYAGGWRPFTSPMYMLPGNYTFRFNDGTHDTTYTIIAGVEKQIP